MKKIFLILALMLIVSIGYSKKDFDPKLQEAITPIEEAYGKTIDEVEKYKPLKRWLYHWDKRIVNGVYPDPIRMYNIYKEEERKEKSNSLQTSDKVWQSIGPFSPPSGFGIGRINRIRIHPQDENTYFVASAGGGVWKSTNGGVNWDILPTTDFLSMNYSDVVISPSNPNIIYLATGDANAAYSNGDFYSVGILKSVDGGQSFNLTNLAFNLSDRVLVASILIDPDDPDYIIAGTSMGIMISEDGGNSWDNYSNDPIKDLEFLPNNKNIVIGTTYSNSGRSKIVRSTNMGKSWNDIQQLSGSVRIELDTDPNFDNYVVGIASMTRPYSFHSYWVSEDGGASFQLKGNSSNTPNILGRTETGTYPPADAEVPDQGWYDLSIEINPSNKNNVVVGGINTWGTADGGNNWIYLNLDMHVDQHYFIFKDGGTLLAANDGGFYNVDFNSGEFTLLSEEMNISQFYKVDFSKDGNYLIGGTQDNSTFARDIEEDTWTHELGGDGMDCHIDPSNSNIWYGSSQYGNFSVSSNAGQNWTPSINEFFLEELYEDEEGAWVAPFDIHPNQTNIVFAGYYSVWKNESFGELNSWVKLSNFNNSRSLEYLEVSERNSNFIVTGWRNAMWITTDGGNNWKRLNVPGSISNASFNRNDPNILYASAAGFSNGNKVHMYNISEDTWTNISGNLPNVQVNVVRHQKDSPERLYIGTDIGVYYSDNGNGFWERYGSGLPFTVVNDIEIDEEMNYMLIGTYGRGMWSNELLFCDEPSFEVELVGNQEPCQGDEPTLRVVSPNPDTQYIWSNGETGSEIQINEAGTYSAREAGDGCVSKSNGLFITFKTAEALDIESINGATICMGDSTELRATFGFSNYLWNTGETTRSIFVKETGTYTVEVEQDNGCITVASFDVEVLEFGIPWIWKTGTVLNVNVESDFYQWYKDDEPIPGANERTLDFESLGVGVYKVKVGIEDCEIFSVSRELDPLSVEFTQDRFEVIPNPNSGLFEIKMEATNVAEYDIRIVNINGEEVYFAENVFLDQTGNRIELKNVPVGVYFISLENDNNKFVNQIVIE